MKCDFNKIGMEFIKITLRRGCSLLNLVHIFRTPFHRNTSGGLLSIFYKGLEILKGYDN